MSFVTGSTDQQPLAVAPSLDPHLDASCENFNPIATPRRTCFRIMKRGEGVNGRDCKRSERSNTHNCKSALINSMIVTIKLSGLNRATLCLTHCGNLLSLRIPYLAEVGYPPETAARMRESTSVLIIINPDRSEEDCQRNFHEDGSCRHTDHRDACLCLRDSREYRPS